MNSTENATTAKLVFAAVIRGGKLVKQDADPTFAPNLERVNNPVLEAKLDAQMARNDELLNSKSYMDFQDYCHGQLRFMRCQPIEWCDNEHEERGWRDAAKYSCDVDTEAYLAKHPVEVIETDW